jgi:hypothetical protein
MGRNEIVELSLFLALKLIALHPQGLVGGQSLVQLSP